MHPSGIGCATGSQNWPLRGGKGAYFQGGVRGTAWVHGKMLHPAAAGTHNFGLMHVCHTEMPVHFGSLIVQMVAIEHVWLFQDDSACGDRLCRSLTGFQRL